MKNQEENHSQESNNPNSNVEMMDLQQQQQQQKIKLLPLGKKTNSSSNKSCLMFIIPLLLLQHHVYLTQGFTITTTSTSKRTTTIRSSFGTQSQTQNRHKSRIIATATVEQSQQEEQELNDNHNSNSSNNKINISISTNVNVNYEGGGGEEHQPTPFNEMIQKFNSYASNISRTRQYIHNSKKSIKIMKKVNANVHHKGVKEEEMINSSSTTCMVAIRSFVRTLQNETQAWKMRNTNENDLMEIEESTAKELQIQINRAIIKALRASADYGDYNMIIKIIDSSIDYTKEIKKVTQVKYVHGNINDNGNASVVEPSFTSVSLLEARVFGEGIAELRRTKASVSKIKKVWKQLIHLGTELELTATTSTPTSTPVHQNLSVLATPPSAYELNAMLLALSSHGKVIAALSLYYEHVLGQCRKKNDEKDNSHGDEKGIIDQTVQDVPSALRIDGDEYTASTLMTILAESIASDVATTAIQNQSKVGTGSRNTKSNSSSKSTTNTAKISTSPCWQWREAASILDRIEKKEREINTKMLNNHVYAAVLKVNDEAAELYKYPGNRHFGSTTAMSILERMKRQCISPDVVTCSAVMSAFDKGKQWKAAVALLKSMERSGVKDEVQIITDVSGNTETNTDTWELPLPNEYTYASAISSCARSGQFDEAIDILDRIRGESNTVVKSNSKKVVPNIWIYNAALAACVPTNNLSKKHRTQNNKRSKLAVKILRRMEKDALEGMDTSPDTVSYNTVIAAIGGLSSRYTNSNNEGLTYDLILSEDRLSVSSKFEKNTIKLLEEMKNESVPRDPITYRNAMLSCRSDAKAAVRLLDIALDDIETFDTSVMEKWVSTKGIQAYLINIALSVCANKGDMDLVAKMFDYMNNHNIHVDSGSMNHLITAISSSGNCEDSMWILNSMKGDGAANAMFEDKYKINIIETGKFGDKPMIEEYHYSSAITGCLRHGQLFPALKILNGMKVHGLKPNESSLKGIILAYCKLATEASSLEFKQARMEMLNSNKKNSRGYILPVKHTTSRTRATAALAMLKGMKEAPVRLQSIVASACAASGMWSESRDLLWSIHVTVVRERDQRLTLQNQGCSLGELPKLHRSLLKLCARSGNIKAALWYADAIQDLSFKFERRKQRRSSYSSTILNQFEPGKNATEMDIAVKNETSVAPPTIKDGIGMGGEEWKLVNIAASKSCHWKVCLGALQFLQPYVEATHPRHAVIEDEHENLSLTILNRKYESLSRTLTDSILAFEARSQYAWAVRAIDDWIEWSGRRPTREAVFSACRILASRGLGNQVTSLVAKVLQVPSHEIDIHDKKEGVIPTYEASYERAIYTEAITSLFKHGFYDNADELYTNAVSQGFLPWAVMDRKSSSQLQVDLHGMNRAIAHSAVRVSLQHLIQSNSNESIERDVIIVTGRGKRSSQHLRPVLRPEVQRMLLEEFYPPLGTTSVPGNMGALSISSADVNTWVKNQQQQKGVRFLAVADVLKGLSSGTRLKQLLMKKVDEPFASDSEI